MKKINKKWKIALATVGWIGLVAGSIVAGITYKNYSEIQKLTDFYNQYAAINTYVPYGTFDNYMKLYNSSNDKKSFINNDYSTTITNFVNNIKILPNDNYSSLMIANIQNSSNEFSQMTNDVNSFNYVNCDSTDFIVGSVILSVFGVIALGFSFSLLHTKFLKRKLQDWLSYYEKTKNDIDEWKKTL